LFFYILDRILVLQYNLSKYVEENNLLPPTQSGFGRHHTTETVVVKVYNDTILALDSGLIVMRPESKAALKTKRISAVALTLFDISAAFDCVDHDILLRLLVSQFGLFSSALQWIASFLSSRSCNIQLRAHTSRTYNILFGVPQGYILDSLLFILYTSNITNIACRLGIIIHLYADDAQLYIKCWVSSWIARNYVQSYHLCGPGLLLSFPLDPSSHAFPIQKMSTYDGTGSNILAS